MRKDDIDRAYLFDAPDNRIKYIADYYGVKEQTNKAIEELNELAVAIAHCGRHPGMEERKNLIEEIADVEIMLSQIKYMHGISQYHIDTVKDYKIKRTIDRIGGKK